jgi:hypothetical protein
VTYPLNPTSLIKRWSFATTSSREFEYRPVGTTSKGAGQTPLSTLNGGSAARFVPHSSRRRSRHVTANQLERPRSQR